ncbi:MAG: nucleotide exchange factor GrpE [Thermovirgaceae bacterium]|nr:nucleotide exchange factor GrpE [Thermovirgaceae bacterium]
MKDNGEPMEKYEDLAEEATKSAQAAPEEKPGIEDLQAEIEDLKDRYLRAYAEMDNMRKRQERDRQDIIKYSKEKILRDFLLVYDAIEKSISTANELYPDDEPFIKGLEMIERLFLETLKKHNVEPIETKNMGFDPTYHEAMMQISRADVDAGMVIDELEKGFMLHDRVLRPAKVTVSG